MPVQVIGSNTAPFGARRRRPRIVRRSPLSDILLAIERDMDRGAEFDLLDRRLQGEADLLAQRLGSTSSEGAKERALAREQFQAQLAEAAKDRTLSREQLAQMGSQFESQMDLSREQAETAREESKRQFGLSERMFEETSQQNKLTGTMNTIGALAGLMQADAERGAVLADRKQRRSASAARLKAGEMASSSEAQRNAFALRAGDIGADLVAGFPLNAPSELDPSVKLGDFLDELQFNMKFADDPDLITASADALPSVIEAAMTGLSSPDLQYTTDPENDPGPQGRLFRISKRAELLSASPINRVREARLSLNPDAAANRAMMGTQLDEVSEQLGGDVGELIGILKANLSGTLEKEPQQMTPTTSEVHTPLMGPPAPDVGPLSMLDEIGRQEAQRNLFQLGMIA